MIYNPAAARGRAARRLQQLQATLGARAEFRPTQHAGHAEELAREAAGQGFAVVAAAGGDGTVHEVANGLLRAGRPDAVLGVLPLGSANDYAYSLRRTAAPGSPPVRAVDVGLVRGEGGRERYFINTLGTGFSGAVTIESRSIRRLQGLALYGLAFLRAWWRRFACPRMTIAFDDTVRRVPTLSLTVAVAHREGGFIVAPEAELDDGLFDYLHAGPLSRWDVLRQLPGLATGRLPADHPALWTGRCRQVQVESGAPLTVHLDGEFFSRSADGVRRLDIRLLPLALRVRLVIPDDLAGHG